MDYKTLIVVCIIEVITKGIPFEVKTEAKGKVEAKNNFYYQVNFEEFFKENPQLKQNNTIRMVPVNKCIEEN